MKTHRILILAFFVIISISAVSQEMLKVKGTVGKEKDDDLFVVCVFGTAACLPLEVDHHIKTEFNGKAVSIKDLPVGLYIEADLEKTTTGQYTIKNMKTDKNKTVICFTEMNNSEEQQLNTLLDNTNGIISHKFFRSSLQVYIEYDPDLISYKTLEKTIADAGLKPE